MDLFMKAAIGTNTYKIDSQWKFYMTQDLKAELCNNLGGGEGWEGGRDIQERGHVHL